MAKDELNARLNAGIMIRRLKRDVLTQLPPKRRTCVTLPPLDDAQLVQIKAGFAELQSLGEDASGFDKGRVLSALYVASGAAKKKAVATYIQGMCESGEKFIVFANHLEMIRSIQATVEKAKLQYMLIVGETPAEERREGVRRFQNDDKCRVAVLSLQAASQGITLTAASTVIFAELHWTPGLIEQAEDRAHRIGQLASVNIHYLIAKGTLDDMMWHMINKKVGIISTTLDGKRHNMGAAKSTAEEQQQQQQQQQNGDADAQRKGSKSNARSRSKSSSTPVLDLDSDDLSDSSPSPSPSPSPSQRSGGSQSKHQLEPSAAAAVPPRAEGDGDSEFGLMDAITEWEASV